ncbi:hypothetical protein V7S43_007121 [Phytophthora oleae]|uniref:Crinkler effector protein N-terminal domain-containing protein n=1 Tax=Phytophthora oleae TaxID=2107226 RepID=A0ABD3FNX9_9STRA
MVTLYCAFVGAAGSVFTVEINETLTVDALKRAIKDNNEDIKCPYRNLKLFLAKKNQGRGAWLTEADVKNGVNDTTGLKPLDAMRAKLHNVQLSDSDVGGVDEADEVEALVSSAGATWDFQNPLDNDKLSDAIREHYDAWSIGSHDKISHPLFVCLSGPGTGKSRVLDEFPTLVKERLFAEENENSEMMRLLETAFTFKVTFENGTTKRFQFSNPEQAIGTRMLYQLQNELAWTDFAEDTSRHCKPNEVIAKLSKITDTPERDMCVILCVDSMQKLKHENGSKDSEFYEAMGALSDLVNSSKCWVIVVFSATIFSPVDEFLAESAQWRYQVPTAVLSRPTVYGEDIFAAFDGNELVALLIDDMGGLGRAVEILYGVMRNARQPVQFVPVLTAVLWKLRSKYPGIDKEMKDMQEVFLAIIARRQVDKYSRFGKLSLDQVISTGLVRREDKFLTCPYVLYLLVDSPSSPWSNDNSYAPKAREEVKPWQTWETFNCKFRALKSVACMGEVNWKDIHCEARFGRGCDRLVIEKPRQYSLCVKKMKTDLEEGFADGDICSCGNDPGRYFLYQPAAGSESGDAFTCVKDVKDGFFHEVHQYKSLQNKFLQKDLMLEKAKAVGKDDLFLLYCTSEVEGDIESLKNCAVVDSTCWKEYYGPFAARAFYVSTVPPPDLNTSPELNLQLVPGIGPVTSKKIAEKRPYSSFEDAHEKTGVNMKTLKKCKLTVEE